MWMKNKSDRQQVARAPRAHVYHSALRCCLRHRSNLMQRSQNNNNKKHVEWYHQIPRTTSMVCCRVWILNVFDIGTFRDVIATISIRERHLAKACASSFVAHSLDCGGCEAHVRVHVQLAKTYTDVAEAHKVRAKPPGWNTIIMNKKTWFWCAQRMNVVINCCWPSVSFFLFFFSFVIHLELLLLLLLARLAVFAEKKKILNKLPWSRTVLPHRSTHAMHIYIIYSLGIVMCVTVCGSKNIKI